MERLSELEKSEVWDRFEGGESQRSISRRLGRSPSTIRTLLLGSGFRRPVPGPEWSSLRLSLTEREEISRGLAAGVSFRCIASGLGRAGSTVSREVTVNGGRDRYRATTAHRASRHRARRPKPTKLGSNHQLREVVEEKLELWWSPGQISDWLTEAYPSEEEMWVSHETIYQSLFVQGKGSLRKELWRCLRTGRATRRPQGRPKSTKGQIRDMVMISERPAEVEDRAVPGHWEGDLLMGSRQTAIGTLVERWSRYVMLFGLPDGNTAEAVRNASHYKPFNGSPTTCGSRSPGIRAERWPNTSNSVSTPEWTSISAIPSRRGSGAPTKTPTACYVNTSPKAPT